MRKLTPIGRAFALAFFALSSLCLGQSTTFNPQRFEQQAQQLIAQMQEPNADPTQFRQQIGQLFQQFQAQTAGMNPAQVQQIRQDLMQKLLPAFTAVMQQRFLNDLKPQLDCTDEEFTALSPVIEQVIDAMTAANERIPGVPRVRGAAPSPVRVAMNDLRTTLQDENAPAVVIRSKLDALRDAREKADNDLESARYQLRSVLTLRQEAVLVSNGLLE